MFLAIVIIKELNTEIPSNYHHVPPHIQLPIQPRRRLLRPCIGQEHPAIRR